jgi:hypothetical protein
MDSGSAVTLREILVAVPRRLCILVRSRTNLDSGGIHLAALFIYLSQSRDGRTHDVIGVGDPAAASTKLCPYVGKGPAMLDYQDDRLL